MMNIEDFRAWARANNRDLVAGVIITIACGLIALIGGTIQAVLHFTAYLDQGAYMALASLPMSPLLGLVSLGGSRLMIRKKRFVFAVFCCTWGAIASYVVLGYFAFFGGVLGLVLVVFSKDEFYS